jgi:hypothetical protein
MVVGGVPLDEEDDDEAAPAPGREQEDEDWYESIRAFEARMEARHGGYDGSTVPFRVIAGKSGNDAGARGTESNSYESREPITNGKPVYRGLKKPTKKQIALDMPPTPRGFEWRPSDEGWSLWRSWSEWDDDKTQRIRKSRYTGHLTQDAWEIMKKEYDSEAYISNVGERIRRHGGRQPIRSV